MGVQRGLSPSTMMSVFWLAPLFILGFARLFLKERTGGKVWLASLVACAGVFALTGPHAMPRWILLVFPLGMAVCFSLYMVMTRALRDEPTRTNLFYTGLGVCLLLAPLMPYTWVAPTRSDLMILAGIALLGLGALFALERVTARSPFSQSAPLVYLQIPFALVIAWSLEQYDPSLRTLIGLLITFGVVLYVWMRRPRAAAMLSPDTGFGGV
jgi:drug/metabolite transporter (DMT)-like permease